MVSEEIRGMIPDFVRGMLSEAEAAEVQAALSASPELAQEYEAARRYYAVLDQLPQVKAPDDFLHRVNQGIDRKPPGERIVRFLFQPLIVKLPLELAGVFACLIAAVIVFKPFSFLRHDMQVAWIPHSSRQSFEETVPSPAAVEQKQTLLRAKAARSAEKSTVQNELAMAGAADKKAAAPEPEPFAETETRTLKAQAKDAAESAAEPPAAAMNTKPSATGYASGVPAPAAAAELQPPAEEQTPAELAEIQPAAPQKSEPAGVYEAAVDIGTIDVAYSAPARADQSMADMESAPAAAPSPERESMKRLEKNDQFTFLEEKKAKAAAPAVPAVQTHAALDSVLVLYDSLLMVSTLRGKTAYTLTVTPGRLEALKRDLARNFRITLHTLDFDPQQARRVKVTFVVNQ
jgi:hypothetical protein